MAYDPLDPNRKEEEGAESQYASLLAPAAGAAAPSAGAAAPAPQAARPGFVNFDRYLGANRDNAKEMTSGVLGKMRTKANTVSDGIGSAESSINEGIRTNTVKGPEAGTVIGTPPTTASTQQANVSALPTPTSLPTSRSGTMPVTIPGSTTARPTTHTAPMPTPYVAPPAPPTSTYENAAALGDSTYKGPTTEAVRSLYDPLIGDLTSGGLDATAATSAHGLQGLIPGGTAFDGALGRGVSGSQFDALKDRFTALKGQYDSSLAGSTTRASDAETSSKDAISKWDALRDTEDGERLTEKSAEETRARNVEIDRNNLRTAFFTDTMPTLAPWIQAAGGMTPEQYKSATDRLSPEDMSDISNGRTPEERFQRFMWFFRKYNK